MFTALSERLTDVLRRLTARGVLGEDEVTAALREMRRYLLEADVHYDVARDLTERARERAVGAIRLKALSPGQQVAKIVHEELAATLGGSRPGPEPLQFATVGLTVILLVGLQGSGKTTTAAKLAWRLKREQKAPAIVAADRSRPAAGDQAAELGRRVGVPVFGAIPGAAFDPGAPLVDLVNAALRLAERARCRAAVVDTAGRLQIDEPLMEELRALKAATRPREVLLVADGMTGQDAVRLAQGFHDGVGLSGAILTKLDGDARGGAALSLRAVTGVPLKFVGVGEAVGGMDGGTATGQLEVFDPLRMAGRILGQGDVAALAERAAAVVDRPAAERLERKARSKRGMDLEDFLEAMRQMRRMGPLKQLAGLLPGMPAKALGAAAAGDERRLRHVEAIILSMTPAERATPALLDGSRRRRIAQGAGRPVQEVNRLLEQFQQMRKLLKKRT